MKWFLVLLCPILVLGSEDLSDYTPIESPYQKEGDKRLDQAEQIWANFQEELSRFLEVGKPSTELREDIAEVQEEFVKFRNKLAKCAISSMESSAGAYLNYSLSMLQATQWYTETMEKMLFPYDWKSHYEEETPKMIHAE